MKKAFIFLSGFILGCIICIALFNLLFSHGREWPKINNKKLLLEECSILINKMNYGELDKSEWTDSIISLKPKYVYINKDYVMIIISTGGIGSSWGYIIVPENKLDLNNFPEVKLWNSCIDKRIYKFTSIE